MSFSKSFWYHLRCIALKPTYKLILFLGNSDFSTSALIRRRRKGCKTLWSWETTLSWSPSCSSVNQRSKSSCDEKMSGKRKLRRAQSSCKLFYKVSIVTEMLNPTCNGVPVIKSRFRHSNIRTICDNEEFSFLIRWASSIMIYCQDNFLSAPFSKRHISYEVTQTSKSPVKSTSLIRRACFTLVFFQK